ncbi:MAG: glycine cleavage system protein R [Luteolibacter sp.]|jgi:glycine cleavage system regulatory protein
MQTSLVMTVLGPDRPGLVRTLADVVKAHDGSWLESRMTRLAGQFAGVVRVECAADNVDAMAKALAALASEGLTVQTVCENAPETAPRATMRVDVTGNDRPGIVSELTAAISAAGGNVEELVTDLESAPMSGHALFRARGLISLPQGTENLAMIAAIERLSSDLTVDIA